MKNLKLKNSIKLLCVMVLGLSLFTSCSQRLVDFTVISSKNVSLHITKSAGKQVKGRSIGFFGLGANIKTAMDKALQSAGPDYDLLVDGVVSQISWGYSVEGIAVKSSDVKAALGEKCFQTWCLEHHAEVQSR